MLIGVSGIDQATLWTQPLLCFSPLHCYDQTETATYVRATNCDGLCEWRVCTCFRTFAGVLITLPCVRISSHIAAFAHALQEDEAYFDHLGQESPNAPATPVASGHGSRIRKVSALSDFAPINLRVARRWALSVQPTYSPFQLDPETGKREGSQRDDAISFSRLCDGPF